MGHCMGIEQFLEIKKSLRSRSQNGSHLTKRVAVRSKPGLRGKVIGPMTKTLNSDVLSARDQARMA